MVLLVSGVKGSLELNGLKRLLVSGVGWSLELCFVMCVWSSFGGAVGFVCLVRCCIVVLCFWGGWWCGVVLLLVLLLLVVCLVLSFWECVGL